MASPTNDTLSVLSGYSASSAASVNNGVAYDRIKQYEEKLKRGNHKPESRAVTISFVATGKIAGENSGSSHVKLTLMIKADVMKNGDPKSADSAAYETIAATLEKAARGVRESNALTCRLGNVKADAAWGEPAEVEVARVPSSKGRR